MPFAVAFQQVSKSYPVGWLRRGRLPAVREVSLTVPTGEVFGLLGPNRAGKTTLVKMLLSLSRPDRGTVFRLGQPADRRATLGRVGYMHENHAFARFLNARELLHLYGALTLIPHDRLSARVDALIERVGLADRARDPIGHFSKGMVQRLGLAQALLNDPDLLVLDEPTEGLDLAGRRLLREVVGDLRSRGKTVLLVSHILSEVEDLCDRVGVLVEGRLIHEGPLGELTRDPAGGPGRSLEQTLHELYEKASR